MAEGVKRRHAAVLLAVPITAGFVAVAPSALRGTPGVTPGAAICYTLQPVPATADREGLTRIRLSVDGISGTANLRLQMPVWTPGEYRIQNHARYVRRLRVAGGSGAIQRADASTWIVPHDGGSTCTVEYELLNARPGLFTENVDVRSRRAFYNGAATFMYVEGRQHEAVRLDVTVPAGWSGPVTALRRLEGTPPDRPAFAADDYDELADAPILIGERILRTFDHGGKSHVVALFGQTQGASPALYLDTLRSVVRSAEEYMGSLPYPTYALFMDLGGHGGGLEHANGARIAWAPWMGNPQLGRFIAHEYFHLWNVKRIRPAALGRLDYQKPPRTRNLWFCEGVTEYVAGHLALRAGILDERSYLDHLAQRITALANTPARTRVTAEQASLRIWEEGSSTGYGGLSVYLKGELIGLCLDLELLRVTGGRYGMRELMRDLMERYGHPKPGYPEDGLREAVTQAGGEAMGAYYDRLARSTQELPVGTALKAAGLQLAGHATSGYAIEPDTAAPASARRLRETWLYGRG